MSRRNLLIGSVSIVLCALAIAWFFSAFERVEREVDLPPRGEARYNPLFALKKTLQARGIETTSRADANVAAMGLAAGDLLLLDIDVRDLGESAAQRIMDWVESGGHLALRLPPGAEGRVGELLSRLGLDVRSEFSCLTWSEKTASAAAPADTAISVAKPPPDDDDSLFPGLDFSPKPDSSDPTAGVFCSHFRFTTEAEYESDFDWLWGNSEQGFVFGRHPWGAGDVLIAADFDFLRNDGLERAGNAALTWQLLAASLGKGRAFLVYDSATPPWYVLLIRQAWYVVLPLMLALLAWLWARSQRLGPVLPLASPHQRALLSHVRAAGEFAFSRGRGAALHAAVLRAFRQRLRRRDPVVAALALDTLVQTLAERHQIPAARVRHALQPQDLARPEQFLAAIRTLMQLRAVI